MARPSLTPKLRRLARRFYRGSILFLIAIAVALVTLDITARLSPYPRLALRRYPASYRILDRHGKLLRELVSDRGQRALWVPIDRIDPRLAAAVVATEDARFYRHGGYDVFAIARAAVHAIVARRIVSGASTLHMQLARLLEPHARRTLAGKLEELFDARRLELAIGKRGVLEQYLNRAPFGPAIIGVEAASQTYFGVPAQRLALAQIALLAGLPKAPTAYDPRRYPAAARRRRNDVLTRMRRAGLIDGSTEQALALTPIVVLPASKAPQAMHFTEMVVARHRQKPKAKASAVPAQSSRPQHALETTLDKTLQALVESTTTDELVALGSRGAHQAAVVIVDNRDCGVRALLGSRRYFEPPDGAVNGASAARQPGSTLKPFAYALALEKGATPATVLADVPTEYGNPGGEIFTPRNFTNRYHGPVLLADALGRSLNVPAVAIAHDIGLHALLAQLKSLGFASLSHPAEHYGLGLVLGSGEVTLLELAGAYTSLARDGRVCQLRLEANDPLRQRRVFSQRTSYLITDALSDERPRLEAFGPRNALMFDFPVAVKTGTSSDFRDSWAAGYTRRYTLAVWMGNFDGSPMQSLSGAAGAGRLFARLLAQLVALDGHTPSRMPAPDDVKQVTVCALSGALAHASCPHRRTLPMAVSQIPRARCHWHRVQRIDRRNGLLAGNSCPTRHVRLVPATVLPARYATWQATSGWAAPIRRYSPLCPHRGPAAGRIEIASPRNGEVYLIEPGYARARQSILLEARAAGPIDKVTFHLNGKRLAQVGWPYQTRLVLRRGRYSLLASASGKRGDRVDFEVG